MERHSRRLSRATIEKDDMGQAESSVEEPWGVEDGVPAPTDDPEWTKIDKVWRKNSVGSFVFFRWSTAFNSKNRFRGSITEHVSRATAKGQRIDFLTIKTFGISEDRYVMGKDIRELFVFASKTALMLDGTEDEIKQRAVLKWSVKDGWASIEESDGISTQASTPLVRFKGEQDDSGLKPGNIAATAVDKGEQILGKTMSVELAADEPGKTRMETEQAKAVERKVEATQPKRKPKAANETESKKQRRVSVAKSIIAPVALQTVNVWTVHGKRTMAGRIAGFSFFN